MGIRIGICAVALFALTGCAGETMPLAVSPSPTTGGAGSVTVAGTPSATPTGATPTSPASAPSGSVVPTAATARPYLTPSSTSAQRGPGAATPDATLPAGVVQAVRWSDQGAFDRVVIEFRGTFGAWEARYVTRVTEDPSDAPVPLQGSAFLHISVQQATFDNAFQAGGGVPHVVYDGPRRWRPALPAVLELADAGDFEAVVGFGVGLRAKTAYRLYRLEAPSRLVLEVAH